ncbi:MAG: DUF2141 domain-containing protein [Spirochaetales bacterium]|nr:DUF2141 domain-containing protein [Spirochaetales bacterium]
MVNKKILLFMSGFLLMVTYIVFAQSGGYIISGEVLIYDVGDIYIYLADEETAKTPMTGNKVIIIKDDSTNSGFRKVSFQFENVEEGVYAIRCYQDVNGNKKMDKGLFGPTEPWWLSYQGERHSRIPKFSDISFRVESDIQDIQINLENK